jgi:exonuclease 3'-5' domain-containing protein 1
LKKLIQIFCDLEGVDLGKLGKTSLFQMTISSLNRTWVFDVTVLGKSVFNTMGSDGQSIRGILESMEIYTVWWDVRNDQNALFFHYQVILNFSSTVDLQTLEQATRTSGGINKHMKYRAGLGDVVAMEGLKCGKMSQEEADEWTKTKTQGKNHFKTNPDGWGVFEQCPLPEFVMKYAGQDTVHISMLYEVYTR